MDDDRVATYYASGVEIQASPWDFTLRFSLREGATAKDVRPLVNVILSPQHAYVVARLLIKNVDAYEQQVGKIDLPPRLLNDLGLEP